MRKILYSFCLLCLFSCAEVRDGESVPVAESEEAVAAVEFKVTGSEESFDYATITRQKLQELYDLEFLKERHPEFSETIKEQLSQLSVVDLKLSVKDSVHIHDVIQIKNTKKLNDSMQSFQLGYKVSSREVTTLDTITAILLTKQITIETEMVNVTSVTFTKEN